MNFTNRLPSFIKNKYFIASITFVVWISFFDEYNFLFQNRLTNQKQELQKELYQLKYQTYQNRNFLNSLNNNAFLEKYAREKFMMKRENEDIFIIE